MINGRLLRTGRAKGVNPPIEDEEYLAAFTEEDGEGELDTTQEEDYVYDDEE
jgi:hypothetical protein